MCYGCYEEAGSPKIVNENTEKAAQLVKVLYDTALGCVGGYGHIVFDDWNIEDVNIDWCIEEANKGEYFSYEDADDREEAKQASLNALVHFRQLSENERYSALAISHNFI